MLSPGSKSATSNNGRIVGGPSASRKRLDVNLLATAIKAGDSLGVQATLANASMSVDDDILFWDYLSDPEAGLCAATCLHYAAFHESLPSVLWLLDVGANPVLPDALGRRPVDVCKSEAIKGELLRGETAYSAKQRMNKRESVGCGLGDAQPRVGTGDESSESLTATDSKEDGVCTVERSEDQSEVAKKAAEMLKEIERVKADRNNERIARAKAAEAQDALHKQLSPILQALEVKLKRQLAVVSGCQADLLDAEKQEVVTETALLAAEAKLGLLEGERTRAAEASFPSDSAVNAIVLKANEELGGLDCRAAIIEAQSMNDPPATIKHLLTAIHAVIQETVSVASPVSTLSTRQSAWASCRQFLRSDEFLDAMFQAAPEQLAARPTILSSISKQMTEHGLSSASVERACAVFVPMFEWLRILVDAACEIQQAAPLPVASTTARLDVEAARDQLGCLQQEVMSDRSLVTANKAKVVQALKDARSTLSELLKVRFQCGLSPAGVWDGSEDVNAVAREPHAVVSRLKGYDSRELTSSRRGSFDESDSKLQCSPSPRRRSSSDASPPTVPRPVSRDASPLVRHRRASMESGTAGRRDRWNSDSKEAPGSDSGVEGDGERWPADTTLSESMRRRNSSHSNSPLRRQSLTDTLPDGVSLQVAASTILTAATTAPVSLALAPTLSSDVSPRVLTLSARRQSLTAGNASLDSPQIRRVRLSSVEATLDPDVLAMLRSQRSNSDSSSDPNDTASVATDPTSPGSLPPGTVDIDGLPVIPAVLSARRNSIVHKTASPLRRKSIGPPMMEAGAPLTDVGGRSGPVSPQKEAPLTRVRRLSLTERVDAPTEMPVAGGRLGSSSTSPVPTGSPLAARSSPSPQPASGTSSGAPHSVPAAMTIALAQSAQKRGAGPVVVHHPAVTSVETGGVNLDGFTPTSAALRRASLVQRPSPLRRQSVTAMDPSAVAAVGNPENRIISLPPQSSPEHSLSPEPVKQFLSPGNSAFRRCLSQSPHEAMLGKSPPPQGPLSPEVAPRSVSEPVSANSSETAFSSREDAAASAPLSGLAGFKGVHADGGVAPGHRVSRTQADHLSLNMEAVHTPAKDAVDTGSRPSSARLSLSGSKASSVRRLVEALSYGEEVMFSSTM